MPYTYTSRDGCRVQVDVAAAFDRLAAAFREAWGLDLLVTDGTRTRAEQEALYQAYLNGGTLAAAPGYSNHEEDGPRGPRALDVHDSGSDAGVTRYGTPRANWLRSNAPAYGFEPAGYSFSQTEPWHIEYTGSLDGTGASAGTEDARLFLESLGYDTGGPGWGPRCDVCAKDFQRSVGLVDDGIWGPNTTAVQRTIEAGRNATDVPTDQVQAALAKAGFDPGRIDGDWGNKTSRALFRWQGKVKLQQDAVFGPASAALLLPAAPVVSDWNLTTRSTADIQRAVGMTGADVDDDHGPKTDARIRAWQTSKGIDSDGVWGITSDGLAFPPAGMKAFGVDFSEARPTIATLQARGVAFVPRYLWNGKYADGRVNKGITAAEHQAYMAAGIQVPLIYEEDGTELKGGFAAGVKAAQEAERHRLREGIPARPIYFNVDYDAPDSDYPAILAALDGAATVIGLQRVGLYGPWGIIRAAFDAGKIAFGMQTYAWSHGQWDPRAQLRQWSNGQWGNTVDFQWAMADEYGQTPVEVKPNPGPDPKPDPEPPILTPEAAGFWQQLFEWLKKWFGGAK